MTETPKICIATPMYGGMCTGFYTRALLNMQAVFNSLGWGYMCNFMFNESLIQRAMNMLCKQFMESDCTHMFFIDADISFDPAQVPAMVWADRDIITGIYPKKEINWQSVEAAMKAGVPTNKLKNHTGSFVVNLVDYAGQVTVPAGEPLEIWNGGTGFMLIKRRVFEEMAKVVPSYTNDVIDTAGTLKADKIVEFFSCPIEEETNRLLSEDFFFCKKWREMGGKVYAAPWVQLGHVGTYVFEGDLLRHE